MKINCTWELYESCFVQQVEEIKQKLRNLFGFAITLVSYGKRMSW